MTTKIQKWGNSYGVRLPKATVKKFSLRAGSSVRIVDTDDNAIHIVPISRHEETLDALVARITPQNLHREIDWGEPRGREVW